MEEKSSLLHKNISYKAEMKEIKDLNNGELDHVSEKAMAPHSSTLAWKIPWTEEPGRLRSVGSRRVGHD